MSNYPYFNTILIPVTSFVISFLVLIHNHCYHKIKYNYASKYYYKSPAQRDADNLLSVDDTTITVSQTNLNEFDVKNIAGKPHVMERQVSDTGISETQTQTQTSDIAFHFNHNNHIPHFKQRSTILYNIKENSYLDNFLFSTLRSPRNWKYILIISGLIALVNTTQSFAIYKLPNTNFNSTIIDLINQSVMIVFVFIFGYLLFKRVYNMVSIIASLVAVIGGLFMGLSGELGIYNGDKSNGSGDSKNYDYMLIVIYGLAAVALSIVFVCMRHILIDSKSIKSFEIVAIVSLVQLVFDLPFAAVYSMIFDSTGNFVKYDYVYGMQCLIGINNADFDDDNKCGLINAYYGLFLFSICFGMFYAQIRLFEKDGVVLYLLIQALSIGISNYVLASEKIMGNMRQSLDNSSLFWAMIIIPIGIFIYGISMEKQIRHEEHLNKKNQHQQQWISDISRLVSIQDEPDIGSDQASDS